MKKRTLRVLAMLLVIAVCSALMPPLTAFAASEDIPSGYVIFDGTYYYLINYDLLLDSYISYIDDPDCGEAALANLYFDTLAMGFEEHFIAYVSGITNKYVSFGAVLDKYIDTEDIGETYSWFNTDAATSAFDELTEIKVLGPDASVIGSITVEADGYEAVPNPIANASVETANPADPSIPENWTNNTWGSHTAAFSYLNEGHSGSRSIKIDVTGYTDGDAKWVFDPVVLEPGDYVFCDYYRSNVDTNVILAVTTTSGALKFIDLPSAPASTSWAKYEAAFTMPDDGESVTVYHIISRNGYLITDDYSISPYSYEGFDRGLLTITFDDGWEGNWNTALPIMQQYGYKSNQFYATTYIENPWADPMLIMHFINDGHEIGSHSITHPDLTTLTESEVEQELEGSKQFLKNTFGLSVQYFATPYGAYNTSVKNKIMACYSAHRTVDIGYNSQDNFDLSRLKSMSILSTTTAAEVRAWARKAKEEKLWLILLYHRVANDPEQYDTTPQLFAQHMQAIAEVNIPVVTFSQAISELESQ